MNINTLTPEEKKALMKQLEAEQKEAKKKRENDIATMKSIMVEALETAVPKCVSMGKAQNSLVDEMFALFYPVIQLKQDVYGVNEKQASHTFTNPNGNSSITIGYNEIIGFDGTEGTGVAKIKQVIASLSSDDENREVLADLLNTFMKPDKKGNLNPTRVAELVSKKEKVNNPLFSEGVDIIVNAQFKTRSSMYVRGWQRIKGEEGKEIKLTFSITAN